MLRISGITEAFGLRMKLSTQGYHPLDGLEFHEIQDIER